jgi:hypothetical protein
MIVVTYSDSMNPARDRVRQANEHRITQVIRKMDEVTAKADVRPRWRAAANLLSSLRFRRLGAELQRAIACQTAIEASEPVCSVAARAGVECPRLTIAV